MSEHKMREALEQIKALTEIPFAHTAGDHELIYQLATEALAQQPVEAEETHGWQPIETAPMNGIYIWLGNESNMRIGFWGIDSWKDMAMSEYTKLDWLRFAPTHWMPLPAVPKPSI